MGRSTSSLGQGLRMPKMNGVGKQTGDRPPTQASRARPRSWPRGASGGFWVGSEAPAPAAAARRSGRGWRLRTAMRVETSAEEPRVECCRGKATPQP